MHEQNLGEFKEMSVPGLRHLVSVQEERTHLLPGGLTFDNVIS